jgi:hypothetical protein
LSAICLDHVLSPPPLDEENPEEPG